MKHPNEDNKLMPSDNSPIGSLQKPWYPAIANPPAIDPSLPNSPMDANETEHLTSALKSVTEIIENHTQAVSESEFKGKTGITMRNQQFLFNAIQYAQDKPNMRPPNLNITEWLLDISNYNSLSFAFRLIDALHKLCYKAMRIFAVSSWKKFRQYYKYIEMLAKSGDSDAQMIYNDLTKYYDHIRNRKKSANDAFEDLNMEMEAMNRLVQDNKKRIDTFLEAEKRLKKSLASDIRTQSGVLNSREDK